MNAENPPDSDRINPESISESEIIARIRIHEGNIRRISESIDVHGLSMVNDLFSDQVFEILKEYITESSLGIARIISPEVADFLNQAIIWELEEINESPLPDTLQYKSIAKLLNAVYIQNAGADLFRKTAYSLSLQASYYLTEKIGDDLDNPLLSDLARIILHQVTKNNLEFGSIFKAVDSVLINPNAPSDIPLLYFGLFKKYCTRYHYEEKIPIIAKHLGGVELSTKFAVKMNLLALGLHAKDLQELSDRGIKSAGKAIQSMIDRYEGLLEEARLKLGKIVKKLVPYDVSTEVGDGTTAIVSPRLEIDGPYLITLGTNTILVMETFYSIKAYLESASNFYQEAFQDDSDIDNNIFNAAVIIRLLNDIGIGVTEPDNARILKEIYSLYHTIENINPKNLRHYFKHIHNLINPNHRNFHEYFFNEIRDHIKNIIILCKDATQNEFNIILDSIPQDNDFATLFYNFLNTIQTAKKTF